MGVPCQGCGREYDVTLFAFGRTIHCTCGERVGLEARVRPAPADTPPRFVADAMLGRLAFWLRIAGFDCVHDPELGDGEIAALALRERRVLLTRDRDLPEEWRVPGIRRVEATTPLSQLREVAARFDLATHARPFRRCGRCNRELESVAVEAVAGRLPDGPRQARSPVRRCAGCDRLYWHGSHTEAMGRALTAAFAAPEG